MSCLSRKKRKASTIKIRSDCKAMSCGKIAPIVKRKTMNFLSKDIFI